MIDRRAALEMAWSLWVALEKHARYSAAHPSDHPPPLRLAATQAATSSPPISGADAARMSPATCGIDAGSIAATFQPACGMAWPLGLAARIGDHQDDRFRLVIPWSHIAYRASPKMLSSRLEPTRPSKRGIRGLSDE